MLITIVRAIKPFQKAEVRFKGRELFQYRYSNTTSYNMYRLTVCCFHGLEEV